MRMGMFDEDENVVEGDTSNAKDVRESLEKAKFICPFFYFSTKLLEAGRKHKKKNGDDDMLSVSFHCYLRKNNYSLEENDILKTDYKAEDFIVREDKLALPERRNREIHFINGTCLSKEGCRNCPFIKDYLEKKNLEGLVIPAEQGEEIIVKQVEHKWGKAASNLFKKGRKDENIKLLNEYVYRLSTNTPCYCERKTKGVVGIESYESEIKMENKAGINKKGLIEKFCELVEMNIKEKQKKSK